MPALNYQAQFATKVAEGLKYHTIRERRATPIKRGDTLMHYTGMRTRNCRKLRADTICTAVTEISIFPMKAEVVLGGNSTYYRAGKFGLSEIRTLATADGFADAEAFFDWFAKTHGPEFHGVLIEWQPWKFPAGDKEFRDWKITAVETEKKGWSITTDDGWSFWVPSSSPVTPAPGMSARFYGRGIGYTVRGLFLDGIRVFYRTEVEHQQHQAEQLYGRDAADWLKRWDDNVNVWSIEMGGLGPGYEQAIQITAAEILRHIIAAGYDHERWADTWEADCKKIDAAVHADTRIHKLGLSGAQYGAARYLAAQIYRRGPIAVMSDERTKDRHIQVSREFPQL